MAQSLRRPLSQCVSISSSLPRRQFSQISPRWGAPRQEALEARPRLRADRSMKVLQREAMTAGELPSDMGLLEEMFVPQRMKLSSLLTSPRRYLKFQWIKARYNFLDYASLLNLYWQSPKAGKRWYHRAYKLDKRAVRPTAIALHTEMYTAFAAGDLPLLKKKCTEGVVESFRGRLRGRKAGEKWAWELLGYNGSSKVVADRAALMPGVDGTGIRQAVVRIASQQKLTRELGGKVVPGTGQSKDLLEYVVVQQNISRWVVEGWKVWGTTTETSIEDVEAWKKKKLDG